MAAVNVFLNCNCNLVCEIFFLIDGNALHKPPQSVSSRSYSMPNQPLWKIDAIT